MFPIQVIIRAVWSVLDVCFHGKGSIVPGKDGVLKACYKRPISGYHREKLPSHLF